MFAGETLDVIEKVGLENIKKRERIMFRKILSPKVKAGEIRLRPFIYMTRQEYI